MIFILLTAREITKIQTEHPDNWQEVLRQMGVVNEMEGYQGSDDPDEMYAWIVKEEQEKFERSLQERLAEKY